jgi:outer membrane protein assembly factor BamE (lipoprotein component of BamABCDE complex)
MNRSIRHTLRKTALPTLLAAAGVWLLVGCVYIPTFGRVVHGKDVSKTVGGEGSRAALRPGEATRDDVLRVLGKPYYAESTGHALAYNWRVQQGFFWYPLCLFAADGIYGERTLVLRFNDDGLLRSYEVFKKDQARSPMADRPQGMQLPPDLLRDWYEQHVRRIHSATQPASPATSQPTTSRPATRTGL